MITREEALLMGVNAPKQHQRIIAKLMFEFSRLFLVEKTMRLEPFPETMLNEGEPSPVPDILLYDNERYETPVIIEINRAEGVKKDLKKIRDLIDADDYGIVEGFVYDYKKNEWHKYKKGVGDVLENPSFCDAVNLDLATLI